MKKKVVTIFISVFFLLFLLFSFIYYIFYSPINPSLKSKVIFIKPNTSFKEVVMLLEEKKIVKDPYRVVVAGKLLGLSKKIKAGEYRVEGMWSVKKLLTHLASNKVILHKVEIPEGLSWWQIAKIILSSKLTDFEHFKKYVFDPNLLKKFGIPQKTAEGFLFPETYFFAKMDRDKTAKEIVTNMIKEFWKKTDRLLWPEGRPDPERLRRIVILASLVEKETSIPSERPVIAGVFLNRLKKNMPLQCDPTVIYGIGPDFNGNLTRKDLRNKDNPYNTYIYRGLPPTPICSPGLDSLRAALYPAKHNYLYFVAKGDGTHIFSRTLKEHNRAVRKYILKR